MLGHDLLAALPELRAHAESRMDSFGVVYRAAGRYEQDEDAGREHEVHDVVHSGPVRLSGVPRGGSPSTRSTEPGGDRQEASRIAHWPVSIPDLRDGDVIHIAAGETAGTWWSVIEADRAEQQTAYRVPVIATEPLEV